MTRNRIFFFLLSLAILLPLLAGTILAATGHENQGGDSLYKYLTVFTDILTRVRDNYVERPDMAELVAGSLDGATDALDPFSLYIPAQAAAPYFAAREIGDRHSGLMMLKDNGVMYVVGVQPGSPAEKAGVALGDIAAEIGGESTRLMPLYRAQEILAGKPGTQVDLHIIRLGDWIDLSLVLGTFEAPAPEFEQQRGVGVLSIPSFDAGTVAAVRQHLAAATAAGQSRLIVDVRGTAGGDPAVAYGVAALFARGELGTLRRRGNTVETFSGREAPAWEGRLVVLTDRGSLGPAEILATVLRQKAAAELVGERTFGHAGRQAVAELSTGGRLLYTDAFYAGPDGEVLTESLLPDLRVSRFEVDGQVDGPVDGQGESKKEGEATKEDIILKKGIDWLLGEEEVSLDKAA